MPINYNFQNSLSLAVSLHRAMNTKDMSKESLETWHKLISAVAEPAYNVFKTTHDSAGLPATLIDEESNSKARSALAKVLRPIVEHIGNVSFKGMEGEALLEVNPAMIDLFASTGWKWGWTYSKEVDDIREELDSVKGEIAIAEAWLEYYNFNGVDESIKAQKAETLNNAKAKYALLDAQRKEAEKKPNGKVKTPIAYDGDSAEWFKVIENAMNDCIAQRHVADYGEYIARVKAKKAKKNLKTAERRKAVKDLQTQAEKDKKTVSESK